MTVRNESTTPDDDQTYEVPVTKNLTGALRQYRAEATALGRVAVLWANAICINQLDARERSQQVMIMRDIYASADIVCVWLGESNPVAEKGLASLFDLGRCEQVDQPGCQRDLEVVADLENGAQSDLESLSKMWNSIPNRDFNGPDYLGLATFYEKRHNWLSNRDVIEWAQAVAALFRLDYWYRAWVIQELQANSVIALHCGQTCRLLKNSDQLSRFLCSKRSAILILSYAMDLPELEEVLKFFKDRNELYKMRNFLTNWHANPTSQGLQVASDVVKEMIESSLEECFRHNMPRVADPRDYVYARLGWSDGFMMLLLKPEYDTSTEDVFISTTVKLLRCTQSWSHSHFFKPSASPFLPSWAIDFSGLGSADVTWISRSKLFGLLKENFRADSSANFRLSNPRPGLLLTSGFVTDQVAAIAPSYCRLLDEPSVHSPGPDKQGKQEGNYYDTVAKMLGFLESNMHQPQFANNDRISRREDVAEAISRTVYVGSSHPHIEYERNMQALCNQDVEYLVEHTYPMIALSPRAFANRLVITQRGHIGLAPPNIQIDDHIAILAGGCMPFAVRKVGEEQIGMERYDTHILLGACYIDGEMLLFLLSSPSTDADYSTIGIMHGEAVHREAKEIYEALKGFSSSSAGNLIIDSRLHRDQGAFTWPTNGIAFPKLID